MATNLPLGDQRRNGPRVWQWAASGLLMVVMAMGGYIVNSWQTATSLTHDADEIQSLQQQVNNLNSTVSNQNAAIEALDKTVAGTDEDLASVKATLADLKEMLRRR